MATKSKNTLKANKVCINLELLKCFRFYNLFDPDVPKIFGRHHHQLIFNLVTTMALSIIFFGILNIFFSVEYTPYNNIIEFLMIIYAYIEIYFSFFKIIIILLHTDVVWNLFNVTRIHFLKSQQCNNYRNILYECRNRTIQITNFYSYFFGVILIQWFLYPIISNYFLLDNKNAYKLNILNFWFPVSTSIYNKYYIIFYIVEMYIAFSGVYILIVVDVFVMCLCLAISAQYNLLTQAYQTIITDDNNSQTETNCDSSKLEDLISVIRDQIQLDQKVKLFYSILQPIVLVFVAINTLLIIVATYSLIIVYKTKKLFSILNIVRLSTSISFISLQLFIYCYLLDKVNVTIKTVNFGIYSCNWTNMNIKFKKFLLLTMRMNEANQLIIKASPKKIINLELFASVMTMSYNMVSVLLNSVNKQNE